MGPRRFCVTVLAIAFAAGLVMSGCGGGGTGGRVITIDEPVKLTRTFEQGESVRYKMTSAGEMAVAMQGFDRVASTQTEFRVTCDFVEVGPEETVMDMRFDHAASSVSEGDAVVVDPSAAALRGKTLEIHLKPDGEVLSFAGLGNEEYFQEGAGQIALMLQGLFPVLPTKALTVGDTWKQDLDVPNISSGTDREFVGETTYTVMGFKEKYGIPCVETSVETTFDFSGRVEQENQAWLMDGTGASEGTVLFSMEDGLILYSSSTTTMDFTGEGSTTAGAAASTTLSAGLKVQGTLELL
jgi:hypothetical protein